MKFPDEFGVPDAARQFVPVLVVDDEPGGAEATVGLLAADRFRGVVERDGDAALAHVRRALTSLVVSELYINTSEGPCLVTVLKGERDRLPRMRVLVHTRHESDADAEWALDAGCDVMVRKSAGEGVLMREVRRIAGVEPDGGDA